jgi:riboflavin synthase
VEKGSFALHGVSLTIARLDGDKLRLALVPHTLAHTNLARVKVGDRLNFEVDLLGKYVESLLGLPGEPVGPRSLVAASAPRRSELDVLRMENWGYGV